MNCMNFVDKKMPHIKNIVIDDVVYLMSNEYFKRLDEKGFKKFEDIGGIIFSLFNKAFNLRDDISVIFTTHVERNIDPITGREKLRPKSIGKLISEKLVVEGLFNYVLFAGSDTDETGKIYKFFVTQSDGSTVAKTVEGVFDDIRIPNDMGYVLDKIREFEEGDDE